MIELYEHNEIGYQKLEGTLKTHQMATINHATGTGKSFIILKYLYMRRHSRILYISPTYIIFSQLINNHMLKLSISLSEFKTLDNVIYANLPKMDMESIAKNYDIIVLDEYHRCGAKEWNKKIVKLLEILEKKYNSKKVIGLTATPIRYLNDSRNMNIELFNGVCASTLTLSYSILNNILPAPIYINTPYSCKAYANRLKGIIDNQVFYNINKKYYMKKLESIKLYIEERNIDLFKKYLKNNGKYIVFCQTISQIDINQEKIKDWFSDYDINFFSIHSGKKNIRNEEELIKFSNLTTGINFLFVVDILNEGIHVDNIDGIIMLRHTQSPIIYFQQLGRLLSFSGRNDNLVVLDLVDNLNAHEVVRDLYDEIINEAKILIEQDKKNSNRYRTILERFKIIDDTIEAKKKLDILALELTEEVIYKKRLYTALNILEKTSDEQERIQAHLDLFNLSKYITIDMYRRIDKLNIADTLFDYNYPDAINGYENLHTKILKELNDSFDNFCQFCKCNKYLPSIISQNASERHLAFYIVENTKKYTKDKRITIKKYISKYKKKNVLDSVFYGLSISPNQYDEFTHLFKATVQKYNCINENIIQFLKRIKGTLGFEIKEIVNKSSKEISISKKAINFFKENGRLPSYSTTNSKETHLFLQIMSNHATKNFVLNYSYYSKYQNVQHISDILTVFIQENKRYPKEEDKEVYKLYKDYKQILKEFLFSKGFEEILNTDYKNKMITKLLLFLKQNNGILPSTTSNDPEEAYLANSFIMYKPILTEDETKLIDSECLKPNSFLNEYIDFLKKNKRYPNLNSKDEQERTLALKYSNSEKWLSPSERQLIKKSVKVSRSILFKNTYLNNCN